MSQGATSAEIKRLALDLGFARVGIARAEPLTEDAARLRAWLAAGHHGQMEYMQENVEVRGDPQHSGMLPSACSVIVLATAYARSAALEGPEPGRIARYAQGRDYHGLLYDRTRALRRYLRAQGAQVRACVDTLPALERAWAARAGVGFVGKNACIIVPGLGSHVLLSLIVTSAQLDPDEPLRERCGECRLCLDACPTHAFVGERQLDARRCIAYLTIEHDGAIDESLRADMGPWLFGCDVCQDVCPFNRRGQRQDAPSVPDPFAPRGRLTELGAEDFLHMDEACFDRYSRGSALRRAGRESMARNAAIVLGNSRERRYLPVLSRAAESDGSAVVREAARWAVDRLRD
ncbi:MAG TPA: tRNA epoxyqueuosine(34) reductase QueG [Polyangiales bacterium]|nr:tRNA epoxyqueuosine(34) reductase QueG [Polyangiales bacterium]